MVRGPTNVLQDSTTEPSTSLDRMPRPPRYVVGMKNLRPGIIAAAMLLVATLSGCAGEPSSQGPTPTASVSESPGAAASETPESTPTATPSAKAIALPDDCRAILSDDVLAQLDGIPVNDPGVGPSGVQGDGSLLCVWRDPRTDTTALATKIQYMDRGPALDMLNGLVNDQGFTCSTPDKGTRCEKTWENGTYPVIDGRTLFWRDDVLVDTTFSNLAPSGYTSSIVAHVFG